MKFILFILSLSLFAGADSVRNSKGVNITLNNKLICLHSSGLFILSNKDIKDPAFDHIYVSRNSFAIESGYIVDNDHRAYIPDKCKIIK